MKRAVEEPEDEKLFFDVPPPSYEIFPHEEEDVFEEAEEFEEDETLEIEAEGVDNEEGKNRRFRYSMNYQSYEATKTQPAEQIRRVLDCVFPGYQRRDPRNWYEMQTQTDVDGSGINYYIGSELTINESLKAQKERKRSVQDKRGSEETKSSSEASKASIIPELASTSRVWDGTPIKIIGKPSREGLYVEIEDKHHKSQTVLIPKDVMDRQNLKMIVVPDIEGIPQVVICVDEDNIEEARETVEPKPTPQTVVLFDRKEDFERTISDNSDVTTTPLDSEPETATEEVPTDEPQDTTDKETDDSKQDFVNSPSDDNGKVFKTLRDSIAVVDQSLTRFGRDDDDDDEMEESSESISLPHLDGPQNSLFLEPIQASDMNSDVCVTLIPLNNPEFEDRAAKDNTVVPVKEEEVITVQPPKEISIVQVSDVVKEEPPVESEVKQDYPEHKQERPRSPSVQDFPLQPTDDFPPNYNKSKLLDLSKSLVTCRPPERVSDTPPRVADSTSIVIIEPPPAPQTFYPDEEVENWVGKEIDDPARVVDWIDRRLDTPAKVGDWVNRRIVRVAEKVAATQIDDERKQAETVPIAQQREEEIPDATRIDAQPREESPEPEPFYTRQRKESSTETQPIVAQPQEKSPEPQPKTLDTSDVLSEPTTNFPKTTFLPEHEQQVEAGPEEEDDGSREDVIPQRMEDEAPRPSVKEWVNVESTIPSDTAICNDEIIKSFISDEIILPAEVNRWTEKQICKPAQAKIDRTGASNLAETKPSRPIEAETEMNTDRFETINDNDEPTRRHEEPSESTGDVDEERQPEVDASVQPEAKQHDDSAREIEDADRWIKEEISDLAEVDNWISKNITTPAFKIGSHHSDVPEPVKEPERPRPSKMIDEPVEHLVPHDDDKLLTEEEQARESPEKKVSLELKDKPVETFPQNVPENERFLPILEEGQPQELPDKKVSPELRDNEEEKFPQNVPDNERFLPISEEEQSRELPDKKVGPELKDNQEESFPKNFPGNECFLPISEEEQSRELPGKEVSPELKGNQEEPFPQILVETDRVHPVPEEPPRKPRLSYAEYLKSIGLDPFRPHPDCPEKPVVESFRSEKPPQGDLQDHGRLRSFTMIDLREPGENRKPSLKQTSTGSIGAYVPSKLLPSQKRDGPRISDLSRSSIIAKKAIENDNYLIRDEETDYVTKNRRKESSLSSTSSKKCPIITNLFKKKKSPRGDSPSSKKSHENSDTSTESNPRQDSPLKTKRVSPLLPTIRETSTPSDLPFRIDPSPLLPTSQETSTPSDLPVRISPTPLPVTVESSTFPDQSIQIESNKDAESPSICQKVVDQPVDTPTLPKMDTKSSAIKAPEASRTPGQLGAAESTIKPLQQCLSDDELHVESKIFSLGKFPKFIDFKESGLYRTEAKPEVEKEGVTKSSSTIPFPPKRGFPLFRDYHELVSGKQYKLENESGNDFKMSKPYEKRASDAQSELTEVISYIVMPEDPITDVNQVLSAEVSTLIEPGQATPRRFSDTKDSAEPHQTAEPPNETATPESKDSSLTANERNRKSIQGMPQLAEKQQEPEVDSNPVDDAASTRGSKPENDFQTSDTVGEKKPLLDTTPPDSIASVEQSLHSTAPNDGVNPNTSPPRRKSEVHPIEPTANERGSHLAVRKSTSSGSSTRSHSPRDATQHNKRPGDQALHHKTEPSAGTASHSSPTKSHYPTSIYHQNCVRTSFDGNQPGPRGSPEPPTSRSASHPRTPPRGLSKNDGHTPVFQNEIKLEISKPRQISASTHLPQTQPRDFVTQPITSQSADNMIGNKEEAKPFFSSGPNSLQSQWSRSKSEGSSKTGSEGKPWKPRPGVPRFADYEMLTDDHDHVGETTPSPAHLQFPDWKGNEENLASAGQTHPVDDQSKNKGGAGIEVAGIREKSPSPVISGKTQVKIPARARSKTAEELKHEIEKEMLPIKLQLDELKKQMYALTPTKGPPYRTGIEHAYRPMPTSYELYRSLEKMAVPATKPYRDELRELRHKKH